MAPALVGGCVSEWCAGEEHWAGGGVGEGEGAGDAMVTQNSLKGTHDEVLVLRCLSAALGQWQQ